LRASASVVKLPPTPREEAVHRRTKIISTFGVLCLAAAALVLLRSPRLTRRGHEGETADNRTPDRATASPSPSRAATLHHLPSGTPMADALPARQTFVAAPGQKPRPIEVDRALRRRSPTTTLGAQGQSRTQGER
jgi:hypothetical protein